MNKDPLVYLEDMMQMIDEIESFTVGYDLDRFSKDLKTFRAVTQCLEIMGEAVKRVPASFRDKYPSVPWRDIAGMRDVLIHSYDGINVETVWKVVAHRLPELKANLKTILTENQPPTTDSSR